MSDQFKAFLIALLLVIVFTLFVYGFACILTPTAHAMDSIGTIEILSINCKFDLSYLADDADAHQHTALLYKRQGCMQVGNHYASQSESGGYWKLENLKVGDKAYLKYVKGNGMEVEHFSYHYRCYAIMICDVSNMEFSHNGIEVKPYADTDLICCTCVGSDSTRNYVAFFERY